MKHFIILFALILMTSISFAQQSGDIEFAADVTAAGGPLLVTVNAGPVWTTLLPGQAYQCIADNVASTTNITPFTGNAETFTPGDIAVTGAPGAQVVLTFALPQKLYPQAGIGHIAMSYSNWSASYVDVVTGVPSIFFNPQIPKTITLDFAGAATIWIGGNPSVSADATDGDTFLGYGLVTAEYTGL